MGLSLAPIALADGIWIVLAVMLVVLFAAGYGFFTRAGSGIYSHPHDPPTDAPGAQGPSEPTGRDEGEGSTLDEHGAK